MKTFYLWLLCWVATFSATLGLLWLTLDWTGLWLAWGRRRHSSVHHVHGPQPGELDNAIFHRDSEREEELSVAKTTQEPTARNSSRTTARPPGE